MRHKLLDLSVMMSNCRAGLCDARIKHDVHTQSAQASRVQFNSNELPLSEATRYVKSGLSDCNYLTAHSVLKTGVM